MKFTIITLFPEMFEGILKYGPLHRVIENAKLSVDFLNLKDFANSPKEVDDYPYGGGAGMVIKPEPVLKALKEAGDGYKILLTPRGEVLTQKFMHFALSNEHIILFCGRYKGVDHRISSYFDMELSVGDFVLSGGEIPAMAILDGVSRLIEGATSHRESVLTDSFQNGLLAEPHYTRPPNFKGQSVPDVLLSGNHEQVALYRKKESIRMTLKKRPDLILNSTFKDNEKKLIIEILKEEIK